MDGDSRTRLKVAITESGKTAKSISTSFGWPVTYVSRVVNGGIKSPDPSRLLAICQAVDADITYVLTGEVTSNSKQKLINNIASSSPDVIDQVANFVREIGLKND